ncbi:HAMP domain-containing sensor histidine kinase [Winogradskya consettensis]|uniref:Signal transduction histidine-protein kinase/phosphatase MprB n=1 Tax=Winogradskya consettensis TaxID=113560 RepID=A0A919VWS0_9ACTN|nr:HAMP domain-containing sensor histidine kinase [Actinoplanes consettensis]GIM83155.1 two-component sensor histidine kinase [Actinoplanes consettensis]
MRWELNRLALAITSMVAIAFLVPLIYATGKIAHDRALSDARQQAAAIVAALAVDADPGLLNNAVASTIAGSTGRLAVHLPGIDTVGTTHVGDTEIEQANQYRRSVTADVPGGLAYLQPSVLSDGRSAVIEVFVPDEEMRRGVWPAWLALVALAFVLVAGSVLFADRLGSRLVRATRELAGSSRRLGSGDLRVRVEPSGPRELQDAAHAFNSMAADLRRLLDAERELAADLSHRLRTPLTALRLDAETMPPGLIADRMRQACDMLDEELEAIIAGARLGVEARGNEQSDLIEVLADRLAFWSALAEDQQRPWEVIGGQTPVPVPLPRSELILAVDSLLGNVFAHTPEGVAFRVTVSPAGLLVDDAGPGIADPETAVQRGVSGAGSSGLGLDIVRRVAEAAGGHMEISRGPLGGARIGLLLGVPQSAPSAPPTEIGRRRRGRAAS